MDDEVYDMIEHAIDLAFFKGNLQLKFYDYLQYRKTKKSEIDEFLNSSTAAELESIIVDLEEYIKGGPDGEHKQLREGYGHIPKPEARKIKNYLSKILDDAKRYSYDRRPGRRKKPSK